MSFDGRCDRRHDVLRATKLRQENFNARAGGLCRLDEDEFVFVGQDHGSRTEGKDRVYARWQLADTNGFRQAAGINGFATPAPEARAIESGAVNSATLNDLFPKTFPFRSHSENGR